MTTLGTKYQQAQNWSARLSIARDIWQEVREESTSGPSTIAQGPYPLEQQPYTPAEFDAEGNQITEQNTSATLAEMETGPKWEAIKSREGI